MTIASPDRSTFVVDHREPAFRLSRTHVVGATQDTFTIDLTTDGRETFVDRGDVRIRARAYWEDDALVFDSVVSRDGEEATNVVRYVLSGDREAIVAEERFRGRSVNYDNTWVLERSESA